MKLQKITKEKAGSAKRRYEDACAAAHALDLLGERWALLVVRELMIGPKRFSDIRDSLPGISANVLTQRLEGLEAVGVVTRRRLPPPASAQVYELTPWGYEAEPIFQTLGRWAARSPLHDPTLPFSAASFILSLRTMFEPQRAANINRNVGLRMGDECFLATLSGGRMEIRRDDVTGADVTFEGAPPVLAAVIYGQEPIPILEANGVLRLEGDRSFAQQFITFFPLPPKVE